MSILNKAFNRVAADLVSAKFDSDPQLHNGEKREESSNKFSSGNYNSNRSSNRTNHTSTNQSEHRTSSLQSLSVSY